MINFANNLSDGSANASYPVDVLIVDDNTDAAQTLAKLLTLKNHTVATAYDGLTAISTAMQLHPSVILLDIIMPPMSGYDVAKVLKEIPALKQTVIVAFTANNSPDDKKQAASVGINHHLVKTTPFDEVNKFITELLMPKTSS
jgi:CheY-like chemotaxis protein